MNERTRMIMAIAISTIIIVVGFSIQNVLAPPSQPISPSRQSEGATSVAEQEQVRALTVIPYGEEPEQQRNRVYENNSIRVEFSSHGGSVVKFELLDHLIDGSIPVDMIFQGESGRKAFDIHFGGADAPTVDAVFNFSATDDPHTIEYQRQFALAENPDVPFTIKKLYRFSPGEYLFELEITIENSVNEIVPLNMDGSAYTVSFGPQIGPAFKILDNRTDFRRYYYFSNGRRRTLRIGRTNIGFVDEGADWVAIAGKYFSVIGVPSANNWEMAISNREVEGVPQAAQLYITRPEIRSSLSIDVFRFYLGPKTTPALGIYNDSQDNASNLTNLNLNRVQDRRLLLGWLETLLKLGLDLFYFLIPNYGIAIILLTILVKLMLWPLTRKSYASTAKMQALGPKLQEIRERFKDQPQVVNREMAAFYKKEGVNPAGGCLPLLLQFPFFIAMFGLFNNNFDLRGAVFIPGWISDLSAPESVWNFGEFVLPLLRWNDLRLLPILFVGTQLLTSKLTQNTAAAANASQAKLLTYVLPIVFFFILYNMPSGLLVYWIVTNVLTTMQQYLNNNKRKGISTR